MKRKILSLIVFQFASIGSYAQTKLGIQFGGNLSHPSIVRDHVVFPYTKWRPGFYIGGIADIPLGEYFYLQTGAQLSLKTWYAKTTNFPTASVTALPYFLEIPANIACKVYAGKGRVFLSAGPYLGYGVFGKVKRSDMSGTEEYKISWGNDESKDFFKPLDVGMNIGFGYEYPSGSFVNIGYQVGFTNLMPGVSNLQYHYTNGMFKIGLGFLYPLKHANKKEA